MESISEIIDHQTFSQDLVEDATDFISVGHNSERQSHPHHEHQEGEPDSGEDLAISLQTMTSCPRTDGSSGGKKHRPGSGSGSGLVSGSGSDSVVMVIDSMGHSNRQTTFQIVSQQMHPRMPLPFGLLQQNSQNTQQCPQRIVSSSPVDFVASDISLDGLTVDSMSQSVLSQEMAIKQEQKLLIAQSKSVDQGHKRIRMHVEVANVNASLGVDVDEMDDISSDDVGCDDEGITLNQHHQQLLEQQQQYGLTSHHPHHQAHSQALHGLHHRSAQLEMGLEADHGEVLSVIVHSQDSDKEVDGEGDADGEGDGDPEDDDDRDSRSRGQMLSHSSYQTLTSVNDRLSPPGFSQTSYATLTPIQPLPPISTMSEKFAYSGHISGGDSGDADVNGGEGVGGVVDGGEVTNHSTDAAGTGLIISGNPASSSFPALTMPMGSGHLSLGVLSGVQSPYSSYEKLSSMISPPPNSYLVSCDLHASASARVSNSSQLQLNHNGQKKESAIAHEHPHGHADVNGGKFPYTGHISGGDSADTDVNGEKFSYSDHISGGDSGDADVNAEKFVYSDHISGAESVPGVNGGTNWLQMHPEQEVRLHMPADLEARFHIPLERRSRLNMPPERGHMNRHLPTATPICPADWKSDDWKHGNGSVVSLSADLPVVVSLTPTPPPVTDDSGAGLKLNERLSPGQRTPFFLDKDQESNTVTTEQCSPNIHGTPHSVCAIRNQPQSALLNGFQGSSQQAKISVPASPKSSVTCAGGGSSRNGHTSDMEEINTKDLAQRISAELKRYSIPQAIFAQRVLCRSQGTLSDLLRNPKPWSKLKSGRETFRRMYKWLQEPEFQRMSALRMAAAQIPQRTLGPGLALGPTTGSTSVIPTDLDSHAGPAMTPNAPPNESASSSASTPVTNVSVANVVSCRRKEEPQIEQMPQPKKPRLVFTDLQRRTLQAIFKETKRPSKEMQVTIARQLGLEPTTVGNFFMNARRRSMDKWRDDDSKTSMHLSHSRQQQRDEQEEDESHSQSQIQIQSHNPASLTQENYSSLHTTAMSPLGDFDEEADMDLELESHDFDLVDPDDHGDTNDPNCDML
ncbi:homeobox protein onecut [Drosophila biarmipes]|uniref:homeobox protein onecut n=1 Tax=Drosophila biarmipes TaxID=125945 RepID=UPI0007E5F145|nr:homeobox protein onecut [Drosophila biarmipes]